MSPSKVKLINGFKVVSVLLITLMIADFYRQFNKEDITNLAINKDSQTKLSQYFSEKINSFCGNESHSHKEISTNGYMYYSFAIILGAFINAKKIMKIGVI